MAHRFSNMQNKCLAINKGNPLDSDLQPGTHQHLCDVQTREFIQILQGHWHVVSIIGTNHPEVNVFDSMYCHCSDHSKVQISSILRTEQKIIQLQYNNVQMQSGEADCGLFTITFATALSNGLHPGAYLFDQTMMRSHLLLCFEKGKLKLFQ